MPETMTTGTLLSVAPPVQHSPHCPRLWRWRRPEQRNGKCPKPRYGVQVPEGRAGISIGLFSRRLEGGAMRRGVACFSSYLGRPTPPGTAEKITDPCMTLHQPWASLLIHGIKRVEGRSWPAPKSLLPGRLWIHAAAKPAPREMLEALERFYKYAYGLDGVTEFQFPSHYPTSVLLGCVNVVGCMKLEDLVSWQDVTEGVRLEGGMTEYCWLCEDPQRLAVPFGMRGQQGIYQLDRRYLDGALRSLRPMTGPSPVKFPVSPLDVLRPPRPSLISRESAESAAEAERLEAEKSQRYSQFLQSIKDKYT